MKAANDRKEEFYDPARKDKILEKKCDAIGVVGRAPQRPNCCAGQSPKVRWKISTEAGSRLCGSKAAMACVRSGGVRSDAIFVGRGPLAFSGCMETVCVCAQPLRSGMCQGDTGRMASSSSSFWRRSQWSSENQVQLGHPASGRMASFSSF